MISLTISAVAFVLVLIAPWAFGSSPPLTITRLVSWFLFSAYSAGFVWVVCKLSAAAGEAATIPDEEKKLPKPFPWREVPTYSALIWALFAVPASLYAVYSSGVAALATWSALLLAVIGFAVALALTAFVKSTMITEDKDAKERTRRVERRRGQRHDLAVLGSSTSAERAAWARALQRQDRHSALWRRAVAVPLGATFGFFEGEYVGGVLVGLPIAAIVIADTWRRKPPALVVGRIAGAVYGVESAPGETPKIGDFISNWMVYGAFQTVPVEVSAACRLHTDGSHVSEPSLHGRQVLGIPESVRARLVEGEHCVLACGHSGRVLCRVADLRD